MLTQNTPATGTGFWALMKDQLQAGGRLWTPTTEEMYYEQIAELPPTAVDGPAFLVGEPYTHASTGEAIYAAFYGKNEQFFARYMTLRQFKAFCRSGYELDR